MKQARLKVFDTTINYYLYGQGQPLLFIHGHRSDALRWKGLILFFGQKYKVYAPDLPGFGQSPALKKVHTMNHYARYLNQFVAQLKLRNYLLCGGSMGGVIALKMLIHKPQLTPSKLILLGTPYDQKYWRVSWGHKLLLNLGRKIQPFLPLCQKVINHDSYLFGLLYLSFTKQDRKKEIIQYEMKQWRVMSLDVWLETMLDMAKVSFSQVKFQTSIPTLIVNAQTDQYFDTEKTVKGLKKICPNNQVFWLPFTSHVPKGELKFKNVKQFLPLLKKI